MHTITPTNRRYAVDPADQPLVESLHCHDPKDAAELRFLLITSWLAETKEKQEDGDADMSLAK